MANFNGKRFVPFSDDTLWNSKMSDGVYDNLFSQRVVSFGYFTDCRILKERIAERLNQEVPEMDNNRQHELAEKIYLELKDQTLFSAC